MVVNSAVVWLGMLLTTEPELRSGWISIRTMPSSETNGRSRSSVPGVQKLDLLDGAGKILGQRLEPRRLPSWISARCLFKTRIRGLARIGAANRLQRPDETGYVVGDEPELDPVCCRCKTLGIRDGSGQSCRSLPATESGWPTLPPAAVPVPTVPSRLARLSVYAKLTPSSVSCSRSTLTMTASFKTWNGRNSRIFCTIWSMILRLDS